MGTHSRSGLATMSREQLLSLVVPVTPLVVLKVFEYAVKTSAIEMIFMPMSNEIRYLGRELVRFFGQKVGKWLSQQALSVTVTFVSFYTRSEVDSIALLFICAVACAMWICVTMHLSRHLIKPKLS
jgi:ATP/ADP translocase